MEGSLMEDSQFDFDGDGGGGAGEAGFGTGWEDDLETMLLKGMKKKAQRRIAMMAAMGVVGVLIGGLWGYGVAAATNDDGGAVVVHDASGCSGDDCKGCEPMHGRHLYDGWSLTCSGARNVDCDGCYGGEVSSAQRDACPHSCICTVSCDHRRGWDINELVVGEDTLYAVHCNDGRWDGEDYCPPGSSECKGADGAALPADRNTLCLDHDDCLSNPCGVGGHCFDAVQNYTCACHQGFSGTNCEVDEDECSNGYTRIDETTRQPENVPPNPCNLQPGAQTGSVRCYESGGIHMFGTSSATLQVMPFQQPPAGYPQFVPSDGKFSNGARHVCVCASTNQTDAGYAGRGAYDTRISFGVDCQAMADSCDSNPCQNGADCSTNSIGGYTCACLGGWSGPNCEYAEHATPTTPVGSTIQAVATFNQDGVVGSITMEQDATDATAPTAVVVHLTGLEDGPNPWHVHSSAVTIPGDCSANSTGGHFLQNSKTHGDIWDLGAAMSLLGAEAAVDAQPGVVNMSATDATLPLSGDQSVIGKSIVIHKSTDNQRWVCATITQVGGAATNGFAMGCGAMAASFAGATDDKSITGDCDGAAGDACHVHCSEGYTTQGQTDYTCSAAGAWEDEDKQSPSVTCTDIDECASDPCEHGECADSTTDHKIAPAVYTCTCEDGYFGDNCDAATDECDSNPCENCETNDCCADGDNAYTCTCKPGYEGDNCDADVDECASEPCQNGATCDDSNTDPHGVEPGVFQCTCVGSYHGELCDTETDFCEPAPCINGATCTGTDDGYTCQCADGFEGDNCDTDIDECASEPCQNEAPCVQGIATYSCTCTAGFLGVNCDADADNCASNPCQQDGSTCETTEDAYTCTCAAGFTGDNCDATDPCTPTNPCQNDGTCDGSTGSAVCTCALGWHGDVCDTETDECASNPCVNGGTCADGDNAYTCTCDAGHSGDNCDEVADPCTPDPCQNGGVCSAGDDGAAECACADGYFGDHCETDVDECEPAPCLNGGTCTDGVNEFTCACADGYGGTTCQCDRTQSVVDGECVTCADGKTSTDDKSACEDCPEGSAGTGGTCEQCAAGKKAMPLTQSTSCEDCTGAEAGNDGTCAVCEAGKQAAEDHHTCTACDAGKYRSSDEPTGLCVACDAGSQPNGGFTECVACPVGKAGDTGTCDSCPAGKEGAPNHPITCTDCGEGTSSPDGTACVVCPDGQSATPDHTDCVVAAQVGESGTCELTSATKCLVIDSVALTTPVHGKHWSDNAAEELAYGFVTDSDSDYIANLIDGECIDSGCGINGDGGIVVAPLAKGDNSDFTVEFAVDTVETCQGLVDLFTTQLADPDSSLMTCIGGGLDPCWELDPDQDLDTHCIDSTDGGR